MSGLEVLGVIASVINVIDFAGKVLQRIKDTSEDVHNTPKAFRDVQSTLPLLALALKQTEQRTKSGALDEEACKALNPVLQDCLLGIRKLGEIFDNCLPKDGSSRIHRGWKAIMSLRQDKKVEEISTMIHNHMITLTYHQSTTSFPSAVDSISTRIAALGVADKVCPKVYSVVPVQWAEDFTGRGEQMDTLRSKLRQPEKHVRVAIVGLGGIGKTRLARQYIEEQKSSDVSVFWLHAGTAERMKSGCHVIAKEVGLQGCDHPDVDILRKVKEWLESEESRKWLLVYDNMDDLGLMYEQDGGRLATYLPRSNRGSIIITTRNRQIGVKFATMKNIIDVSALTHAESVTLMATRLGEPTAESNPELTKLAEALDGVPLALVQAISFVQENDSTPGRYLELYEANDRNKIDLLSQNFEDDTRDHELKNPIASTWIVTFEYMEKHQSLPADILCMMCLFDAQAIPEALVSLMPENDSITSTELERALGVLQAYSLIHRRQVTGDSHHRMGRLFDLHRLVRLVTRNWLAMRSTHNYWMAKAVDVLSTKYDEIKGLEPGEQFEDEFIILPHALSLISSVKCD